MFKHLTLAAVSLATAALVWAQPAQPPVQLDPDGNGLYDDVERKALLDVLQSLYPELEGPFDLDGDGKVTVQEQAEGRHPLSMLIPREAIRDAQIPWGIDIFPEWIMSGYFQEDVAEGDVVEHAPRGTITSRVAKQDSAAKRARKTAARSGIEFAANSGQHFSMEGVRDARWNYRWCLLTFRIDAESGDSDETILLDVNSGRGSGKSTPRIWYNKKTGLHIQYVGHNTNGVDRRVMVSKDVVADGKTWNVVVCGIRWGQMYASVNGRPLTTETPQPARFVSDLAHDTTTYLGDSRSGNMAWAYDAVVLGQTEPTEAMVRKLTGWAAHRLGIQELLPEDHPYRSTRPVLDDEDLPARYVHDEEKWNEWGKQATDKSITRVNAGGPRVEPKGFERVFYDDFRAFRVTPSTSGEGDLWHAPGFNTAVGNKATLATPGRVPNTYPYDAENQKQILSLVKHNNKWWGSAFYSVNDMGHGYTWAGPKIFRIRCMFPKKAPEELGVGLFPAFWSYDVDFLFWRTANRIEVDYFEFEGKNPVWLNGFSTHYHYSHFRQNIHAKNPQSYKRFKVYGGNLTEEESKIPGGIYVWDGQYHTWEFVMDEDLTYINVTIPGENGEEKWVEVCRTPTAPTYLQRLALLLDYALKVTGDPPTDERQDFVVDFVEVLQKTEQIEALPELFAARPTLSGENKAGSTITCDPKIEGVSDIRYFWFADGYPLTWGPDNTYTLTEADAGKEIRCLVKAVGALDQPEAWSEILK